MIQRLQWIDRHVSFSTISVLDRQRAETQFIHRFQDLAGYCKKLGPDDIVAIEMSCGLFHS